MSKLNITAVGDGKCAECDREKNGAKFRVNPTGSLVFMCWEHFRLLAIALDERQPSKTPVVVNQPRSCPSCHCDNCCPHCRARRNSGRSQTMGETWSHSSGRSHGCSTSEQESHGVTEGHSEQRSWSHTTGETESEGVSHGRSSTETDTHGTNEGRSELSSESS